MKKAVIIGADGQDGSFMYDLLGSLDFFVYAIVRNTKKLKWLVPRKTSKILFLDLSSIEAISNFLKMYEPNEVYYLAGYTNTFNPWENTLEITEQNCKFPHIFLESVIKHRFTTKQDVRIFFASSAEVFGNSTSSPQNENSRVAPRYVYGCTKLYLQNLVDVYVRKHSLFACYGILYGHESERRSQGFLSQKVVTAAVNIKSGRDDKLVVGSINNLKDWSHARDFCRAFKLMLQQDTPENFVIGSGELHTVEEFISEVFNLLDLDYKKYLRIDSSYVRQDNTVLCADTKKIHELLGWKKEIDFRELVRIMVDKKISRTTEYVQS